MTLQSIFTILTTSIVSAVLITFGAVAMGLAIFRTKRIFGIIKDIKHLGRWKLLIGFMIVFLAGYLTIIIGYFFHLNEYYETLIGLIFLLGAVFVYLVVVTGVQTIDELRKTLLSKDEKVVMLKELHHRVKNNLQIVISLMHLQSDKLKGDSEKEIFNDCENRIQAMALVHENLYKSDSLSTISLSHYVEDLMSYLLSREEKISYTTNVIEMQLSIDKMVPLGIIINELVSNTIKHAFTGQEQGQISVSISKSNDDKCLFVFSDNGKGYDTSKFYNPSGKSLGLDLVKSLAEQIDGEISVDSQIGKGSTYTINCY